jgi:hypothetical protein
MGLATRQCKLTLNSSDPGLQASPAQLGDSSSPYPPIIRSVKANVYMQIPVQPFLPEREKDEQNIPKGTQTYTDYQS